MASPAVAWVGVGSNAGKVMRAESLNSAWLVFSGSLSMSVNTTNFIEGTSSLSEKNSAATKEGYTVDTTDVIGEPFNFSSGGGNDGDHIFAWLSAYESWDTFTNGGFGIIVADDLATDSAGVWYVGPQAGYIGGWRSYVINPAAAFNAVVAGTASWTTGGNPAQLTGVDGFGARWKITTSISGNIDNCFVDNMSVGTGYGITLGDAGSTEGKFSDFITFEEVTTTGRFGGLRGISGILFAKCKLYIGAASGAANTEFIDDGFTIVWEKNTLSDGTSSAVASTFYQLGLRKGTGTTDVTLSNGSFSAVAPHEVYAQLTGSTSCTMTNVNFSRARLIDLDSVVSWTGGQVVDSGQITFTSGAPTLSGVNVINSTDIYAMSISNVSQFANVTNLTFDGAGTGGAGSCGLRLNLGAVGGASISVEEVTFQNRVSGSHDILIPADVTGTITISYSGTAPTVNDLRDPDDFTLVGASVDATVTVKDTASPPVAIQSANVFLKADAGGPFPSDVTVTIANSGTTATVTHTTHGLASSDKVLINGASHWQNNGVFAITVTGASTYTYTMPSDPGSSPGGTIKATFVVLEGLTNVSGIITMSRVFSSAQPVSGWARKSSGSPYYVTGPISGSVSASTGFATTIQLISDE